MLRKFSNIQEVESIAMDAHDEILVELDDELSQRAELPGNSQFTIDITNELASLKSTLELALKSIEGLKARVE